MFSQLISPCCPREACANPLVSPDEVVCVVDFHALARTCRGKKRLGEPEAAAIEGLGKGAAYRCPLCQQWHNGKARPDAARFKVLVRDTVRALASDPRVGNRGILKLADAWRPGMSEREEWANSLDQRLAFA